MKILKKVISFFMCLAIAFVLSTPALAADINMPSTSKLLGYYNCPSYDYLMISIEREEFVLYGVWSETAQKYIAGVATEGYMTKDNFLATVSSYNQINISTNSVVQRYYSEATVQRSVSQKFSIFNNLKSTTINNHSSCSTSNKFTQEY